MHAPARLRRPILLATVFVTGAGILALEIVGARLISPQFGVSLYVWSALITVTLVALAAGYAAGGWLADRRASPGDLGLLIALAALGVAAVPPLASPVFDATARLGLRLGALGSAFLLVAAPLAALAMVTPYAVKLLAAGTGHIGVSTGVVYAVSTAGSVAGALAAGFALVPRLSLDAICYLLALVLIVAAALSWLAAGASPRRMVPTILLGLLTLLISAIGFRSPEPAFFSGELFHGQSLYGELRVIDVAGARLLLLNGIIQSGLDAGGASIYPYSHAMERLLPPDARRLLLVGLGGGALVRSLQRGPMVVDVVELDPLVADLARRYFGYAPGAGTLFIEDGRRFLNTTDRRYDAILLDAYAAEAPPHHLLSVEAFTMVRARLAPEGVLLLNYREVAGDRRGSQAIPALMRTLHAVFPAVTL
ncbi:MAG: fused MFS/spermidine synthase, partial [Nitrospirota bacterium]